MNKILTRKIPIGANPKCLIAKVVRIEIYTILNKYNNILLYKLLYLKIMFYKKFLK